MRNDSAAPGSGSPEQAWWEAVGHWGERLRASGGVAFLEAAGAEGLQALTRFALGELARRMRQGLDWNPSSATETCGQAPGVARRTRELLDRWAEAHGRLERLWSAIAQSAATKLAARIRAPQAAAGIQHMRELYGLVIDCAEEAYGEVARDEEYSRTQAALINTMAALRGQWRRQGGFTADTLRAAPPAQEAGCSLREAVWRRDKVVLYRYRPLPFVRHVRRGPVLISYGFVNRPYVLDLQPDRSLIRRLLAAGVEVYLIDWGYPDDADSHLGLSEYIGGYLGGCVRHIIETRRARALTLAGVCQGGTLALCYCALNPGQVANLILLGTPVDFHTRDNLLSRWARYLDAQLLARSGNLPGTCLTGAFLALNPFRLMHQKYITLMEQAGDAGAMELFGRMERWIFDSPDQAARAFSQFLRGFYQENGLMRGTLTIGRRTLDLKRLHQPILNIYATRDHIVPPSASRPVGRLVSSKDYTEYAVDAGHIGLYVSSRAGGCVPARIASWLGERAAVP
jgi:polyhydroxyalkanoate synthase